MAVKEKIRIRLKSYDHQLVDTAAEKIVETAKRTGARVSGPIPLPTEREIVTILRAVHKYKDSREQFEMRTHKRLIDILRPSNKTVEALRGLEGFSHLWLIWEFSQTRQGRWSPTVRPPRLGGNKRLGVFATRSPFRPNPLGLSCVRLLEVGQDDESGPVLLVAGADLMDGTPIYDIKPYLPYADCKPDAVGGFAAQPKGAREKKGSTSIVAVVVWIIILIQFLRIFFNF